MLAELDLITRFNTEKFKTKFACEVKNFNPEDYFDRKEARKLDPFSMYALVAADEAIKDSGLDLGTRIDKTELVLFSDPVLVDSALFRMK